jgi:hypothetical protein
MIGSAPAFLSLRARFGVDFKDAQVVDETARQAYAPIPGAGRKMFRISVCLSSFIIIMSHSFT